MRYHVEFLDKYDVPCATFDTVHSMEDAVALWRAVRESEPGTHAPTIVNEFGAMIRLPRDDPAYADN